MSRGIVFGVLLVLAWAGARTVLAADPPSRPNPLPASAERDAPKTTNTASTANTASKANGTDDASDADVLEFVREHQPELADLFAFLKRRQPTAYREAMRESRKVRDRLEGLKSRDPELYAVELAIWKNSAQIRLWAAAVSAKGKELSDEDRLRLKELVGLESELAIQRLTIEQARAKARLEQLSQQLERRQDQRDAMIAKSLKAWENRIERGLTKTRPKPSAAQSKAASD